MEFAREFIMTDGQLLAIDFDVIESIAEDEKGQAVLTLETGRREITTKDHYQSLKEASSPDFPKALRMVELTVEKRGILVRIKRIYGLEQKKDGSAILFLRSGAHYKLDEDFDSAKAAILKADGRVAAEPEHSVL